MRRLPGVGGLFFRRTANWHYGCYGTPISSLICVRVHCALFGAHLRRTHRADQTGTPGVYPHVEASLPSCRCSRCGRCGADRAFLADHESHLLCPPRKTVSAPHLSILGVASFQLHRAVNHAILQAFGPRQHPGTYHGLGRRHQDRNQFHPVGMPSDNIYGAPSEPACATTSRC